MTADSQDLAGHLGALCDPQTYVPCRASEEVLRCLSSLVRGGEPTVVLHGPLGIGKSMSLLILAERLENECRVIQLEASDSPEPELCRRALALLAEPAADDPVRALVRAADRVRDGQLPILLLVDHANWAPIESALQLARAAQTASPHLCTLFALADDRGAQEFARALAAESRVATVSFGQPQQVALRCGETETPSEAREVLLGGGGGGKRAATAVAPPPTRAPGPRPAGASGALSLGSMLLGRRSGTAPDLAIDPSASGGQPTPAEPATPAASVRRLLGSADREHGLDPELGREPDQMVEQSNRPGSAPELTIRPDTVRKIGRFFLRLVVAFAIVTAAIQFLTPLVEIAIARGARNLLGLVSSQYYLKTIEFIEGGYAFTTWIGPLRGSFKLPSLLFTFGFPIGYAMALPGVLTARYWLRALAVLLISYFVCAICVAVVCDARLTSTFLQFGIALQPEWRRELVLDIQHYLWMFSVRLYPLLAVVLLAAVSGQFRRVAAQTTPLAVRVLQWSVAGALSLLVIACVGFDRVSEERIRAVAQESLSRRLDGLEELNPEIGPGLVKLAEFLHRQGNDRAAVNAYRLALEHLEGAPRREVRAQRDLLHIAIKAQMLKEARLRREGRQPRPALP